MPPAAPPILFSAWLMTAAVCLSLGFVLLLVWVRRRDAVSYLLLAGACAAAAGSAWGEAWLSRVTSVDEFVRAFTWSGTFIGLELIALSWFVVHYRGAGRRWLAWTATIGWVIALVADRVLPFGVTFSEVTGIASRSTPWGETFVVAQSRASFLKLIPDLATLAVLALAVDETIACARRRLPRQALVMGSVAFFLITGLTQAVTVDLGFLPLPYLISCFFLAIVVVTTVDLAERVVQSSALADTALAQERRWRSLLENVRLLVVGVDRDGCVDYANPHFTAISGYAPAEVIGRPYVDLLPEGDRADSSARFRSAMDGRAEARAELSLLTRAGEARRVLWSNVTLRDPEGAATGVLSIGADLTDQRRAESDRDDAHRDLTTALRQLEELSARIREENVYLKEEIRVEGDFSEIIGKSDALKYVLHRVEQVAATDATVLVEGETGVGKELIARAVHDASGRRQHPFVRVNCAALPANLVEAELFGHEKGSFTGADRQRIGRFELADGGTIFLDELGDLPLETQAKLLRVLQDGELERVGSSRTITVHPRVVAATNHDLKAAVEQGKFREDLFYRVQVYPITVPPLRQRREDIPLLVRHFVKQIAQRTRRTIEVVPGPVMQDLVRYDWPGNVRELQNVLERAVITSPDTALRLPEALVSPVPDAGDAKSALPRTLEEVERDHIVAVLRLTRQQLAGKGGAAEILGLPPSTLRSRMKKLGIQADGRVGPKPVPPAKTV